MQVVNSSGFRTLTDERTPFGRPSLRAVAVNNWSCELCAKNDINWIAHIVSTANTYNTTNGHVTQSVNGRPAPSAIIWETWPDTQQLTRQYCVLNWRPSVAAMGSGRDQLTYPWASPLLQGKPHPHASLTYYLYANGSVNWSARVFCLLSFQ